MANRFRVFFYLEGRPAETFEKIENKPRVVARAVEQYLSLGPTLRTIESRLAAIEGRLGCITVLEKAERPADASDNDTEKKIDQLIEKMLFD